MGSLLAILMAQVWWAGLAIVAVSAQPGTREELIAREGNIKDCTRRRSSGIVREDRMSR